jgi:hypothetical protein
VVTFKEHPLFLHALFPAVMPPFVAFPEHSLWNVVEGLRSGPLDAQNVVLSPPILLFEIKKSRKVRDQVGKEAAASP